VTDPDLVAALDALVGAGAAAGLSPDDVRAEGCALAATLAESVPGAAQAWSAALDAGVQDFFDAASRARRWREAPTAGLTALLAAGSSQAPAYARALVEVAAAACTLGEPSVRAIGNASVAAAAQLRAAGVTPDPASPRAPGAPAVDASLTPRSTGPGHGPGTAVSTTEAAAPEQQPEQEPEPARSLEELLADLDGLIGLDAVKREIHRQAAVLRIEQLRVAAGLRSPTITRHLVFLGNPGTGKTTVARLVAGIYRALGLLSRGQLVEVDRSELVAGYLGQTATKTAEVVATAVGGVLFVDEAYALAGDQYGNEAIDTLVKEMEDRRDDLVVVVAGYPAPMERFIGSNPGLASRFRTVITFADYSDDELVAIFERLAGDADYGPTPEAVDRFRDILATAPRGEGFGNGRFARNVLEAAVGRHAWRLRDEPSPTPEQLRELLPADLSDEASDFEEATP
jgi:hypothetical protein